jgi:hypothetical protein
MNKQWIVYSPYTDIDFFDDYDKALKEYESIKEHLMAEGHEEGTQVHLMETIKVATSVVDEERMKINTPEQEGFEWEHWAKWDELNSTIDWEHSYEKESFLRGQKIEQLKKGLKSIVEIIAYEDDEKMADSILKTIKKTLND